MSLDVPEDRAFITELSREIVSELAPEELDLFGELVQEYYDDPSPPDLSAGGSDEPLGFGPGEILVAVTPAATAMVVAVFGYVLKAVVNQFKDEGAAYAKKWVQELFEERKKKEKKPAREAKSEDQEEAVPAQIVENNPTPLTQEQLKYAHQLAVEEAARFGIGGSESQAMADALLRRLVLS